jgi:hypothetical protein
VVKYVREALLGSCGALLRVGFEVQELLLYAARLLLHLQQTATLYCCLFSCSLLLPLYYCLFLSCCMLLASSSTWSSSNDAVQ